MSEVPQGSESVAAPARSDRRRLITGAFIGVIAAVGLCFASVFVGSALDERANPDADLAGLAGAVGGAMVGLLMVLIVASSVTVMGRRRRSPMIEGLGVGMFLALIVAGLIAGVCAIGG